VNVSLLALRSHVPTLPNEPESVAERLRAGGIGVARIVALSELLKPVVVGHVESVTQHPNADRLKVCVVNDGTEQRLQIVTGADNVAAGAFYPLIRGGTTLPNGTRIKKGKLRGEVSDGMMLSERELQLSDEHDGIIRLPDMYEIGSEAGDHFALEEIVLDLEALSFSAGGDLVPETLEDVLTSVTALFFEPSAEGRTEEGYLGEGVSDSATIQIDEIEFVP